MIALIVSIPIGWLILKMLWSPIYIAPPAPQVVIHLHLLIAPTERPVASLAAARCKARHSSRSTASRSTASRPG
jgi:hypothetical protein